MCATYRLVFRVTILQPFPEVHKYNTFNLLTVYLTVLVGTFAVDPQKTSGSQCLDR